MIYLFLFLGLSITVNLLSWKRIDKSQRLIIKWFYIFYFSTNVFGAIIFGIAQEVSFGALMDTFVELYLRGNFIDSHKSFLYWSLLFAPFIIIPFIGVIRFTFKSFQKSRVSLEISNLGFSFAASVLVLLVLFEVIATNNMGILTLDFLQSSEGDYEGYLLQRTQLFSGLSNRFFGLIYVSIPFMSLIAIFKAFQGKSPKFWWLAAMVLLTFCAIICLGINQKAPIVILFLGVFLGVSVIKGMRVGQLILFGVLIIFTINTLQFFLLGSDGWDSLTGVFEIIFRAPQSIPAYVNFYPDTLPFVGVDYGVLSQMGITSVAQDNIEIAHLIFGTQSEKIGVFASVSSPFQFRAFAQAGYGFALFNIFLVGLFVKVVAWVYNSNSLGDKPISYALYCQMIISFYYLAQTHIRDVFWSSYGLYWLIFAYLVLYFMQKVVVDILLAPSVERQSN